MKYRIQFSAVYGNTDCNAILNTIESIKDKVFNPSGHTIIPIIRETKKLEYLVDTIIVPTEYASIDFDSDEITHSDTPSGSGFVLELDLSFDDINDYHECINYLESVKSSSDETKNRYCRHYVCNHDEIPLKKDDGYTFMDFDETSITFPIPDEPNI